MIRTARRSEADAVAAIINAAFEVERPFRKGDRTSGAEIGKLIERDTILVFEQDGRLIGAIHASVNPPAGYFGMLAVDAGARRSGVGRALLEAAEAHCRAAGCTVMTLSTGEDRTELFPYYGKLGYRVTHSEISANPAFKHPIRVVHMAKDL